MTTCTTCGCAPLNRLSVLSIPIISCIQYPGMYNGGWGEGGGGGGGGVTGDVRSVAKFLAPINQTRGDHVIA